MVVGRRFNLGSLGERQREGAPTCCPLPGEAAGTLPPRYALCLPPPHPRPRLRSLVLDLEVEVPAEPVVEEGLLHVAGGCQLWGEGG